MQVKTHKLKACLALRAAFIVLCALCFAMPMVAQETVKMKNGSMTVPSTGYYQFFDSGGEHQKMPIDDQPNHYNWANMYQSPELYELTFEPNSMNNQEGVKVTFDYLLINNDWLYVYEGESSSTGTLIAAFTGDNDYTDGVAGDGVHYSADGEKLGPYENNNNKLTVQSTGAITFRFEADDHWRDHGWRATVQGVTAITQPTPPVVLMQKCANALQLFQTTVGSTMFYSIGYGQVPNDPDTRDPLSVTQSYTPGEIITIPADATYPVYVKAVSKVGENVSSVSTYKFEDALQQPTAPTLQLVSGTSRVHITTEVYTGNDTYYVRYTTSGEDPTTANPFSSQDPSGYTEIVQDPETKKVDVYIEITEPCTLQAVKRGTNCPENFSEIVPLTITTVYVPAPVITITEDGSTTITCSLDNATIKYTTDGSDPKTSTTVHTYSEAFNVVPGTTVTAYAYVGTTGYEPSPLASEIYVPEGGSGVYNNSIVLLDDREDHTWSYYSVGGTDNPVHSLNPADVKITYVGNGKKYTSTTATPSGDLSDASGVQVSATESANQFIYLKTLENAEEDGSGNYLYSLIPNPFSKRPTFNSNNTTYYTGFYGWRVKRLAGVTITGYQVGSIIPAETEIEFVTTNSKGNEVDFEAVWARAFVFTTVANLNNAGNNAYVSDANGEHRAYERNFVVVSDNVGNTANTRPATITCLNPDGSGTVATRTGAFNLSADTKFEYINLSNTNGTFSANNHYLCFGRGIIASQSAASLVQGISAAIDGGLNYTIRMESGRYDKLAFVRTGDTHQQGRVIVKAILGCDYDRAKGINSLLSISRSNNLFYSQNVRFSDPSNLDAKTFDCVVKSGEYQASVTNDGGFEHSFYCGNNCTSGTNITGTHYPGTRYVTVEGGELASMNGGKGVNNSIVNSNGPQATPDNNTFVLRIKNGSFRGSVFGAAANTESQGSRRIVITGGTIKGWVAGGANGTNSTWGASVTTGNSHIYVGGNAIIGGSNPNTVNGTVGGNVFGAGRGNANQAASMVNSEVVIADNADILHNVYGGGNYGYITTESNVYILGGTVGENVFGGAYGNTGNATYNYAIPTANVYVTGGTIGGSVYGGSNSSGTVGVNGAAGVNLATVNMSGGETTNVFGGGLGESTNMANGTIVNVSGGLINNNVYGGGEEGTVNGDTHVNVSGGTMKDVFGAGKGGTTTAQVTGQTFVNVTGGSMANVYGGGEAGDVMGESSSQTQTKNVIVTVYGNHDQNDNRRARLIFSAGQPQTVYWPRTGNSTNGQSTTVSVPCDESIDVTFYYTRTPSGLSYNIKSEDGTITYVNHPTQPNLNTTDSFTVPSDPVSVDAEVRSTVRIAGGTVSNNVFGGGKLGKTGGGVMVNMDGGTVEGSVFGGAFGTKGTVYVAGLRTVNMRGGTVNKNVYGGSRNGDDALEFNPTPAFASNTTANTASVVNFSGGHVYYQVFASGYFGNVYGSTYAFIGTNAIMNAPHHIATTEGTYNAEYFGNHQALQIDGSVWAGGDFGNYDGTKFGDPTITGNSCIYVDGTDYETNGTTINNLYMNIGGSLFGCGTSCDAGKGTRHIIVRKYGDKVANPDWNSGSKEAVVEKYTNATRSLYSIQRADYLDIEDAHINLLGQGKINSLVSTEHYSIHEFGWVRVSNGSSLFLNAPADQIVKFGSYSVDDVYSVDPAPTYTKIVHAGTTSTLEDTPNKIRVNTGSYIMIHHDGVAAGNHSRAEGYGELEGFAYMMTEGENETCAYARPRQGTDQGNTIPANNPNYDNPNDGGWVSYNSQYNTFYDSGTSGCGTTGTGVMQMPYENHTAPSKNGEQYFRIWRYGDKYLYREGVFVAQSDGTSNFSTTDVTIPLPASLGQGSYFRIKSLSDGNTTIDYGDDVMTVNAAYTEPTVVGNTVINPEDGEHSNWMYFSTTDPYWMAGQAHNQSNIVQGKTFITNNPNVNFGLVAIPQGSIAGEQTLLICENSDEQLALAKWYNTDETQNGSIVFRLTYNNALTNNVVWDPITIVFEHVDASGSVKEEITVKLTITTLTNIEQPFSTEVYAIMRGNGDSKAGTYTAKVVLPQYVMNVNETGEISQWTCLNVAWTPNTEAGFDNNTWVTSTSNPYLTHDDKFALTFKPGLNYDQTTGWDEYYQGADLNSYGWNQTSLVLGRTTARDPIAFDFTLQFDEGMHVDDNVLMGKLVFKMHFTNYAGAANATPAYEKDLYITVYVYRIGIGNIYYLDGVHGNNLYSGTYPNAAKKTLSGIFNRTDYRYGDYIFIVNTVTADGNLEWNGKQYQEVTLYRYPGRHELADYADLIETSYWEDYDRANNACFEGTLVQVGGTNTGNMTMNGIVLDGFHDLTEVGTKLYPQLEGQLFQTGLDENENPIYDQLSWSGTYVNPSSPLVNIQSGSTLTMYGQSRMTGNYNTNDGGAVYNAGTFNIYDGSEISGNGVVNGKNGGGVYLASGAKLQLSDLVTINGNHLFTAGETNGSDVLGINNNVYLPNYTSVVTVGTATTTDVYTVLDNNSRIGITSLPENEWEYQEALKWYLPVAFSDGGLANYLQNIIDNGVIFDDKDEYDVVSLNNADWVNNPTDYLYFVGTWVTAVKKNPQDPDHPNNFNPLNIDTEDELAWLISYVNGLNHADPHPNTEATLAADLDMNAHIWVPIGSAKVPYTGDFDGNGHVVVGLRSPLNNTHMGMFGITNGADIGNVIAEANFQGGTMKNVGTVIGTMNGGTLSHVEAAGTLVGTSMTNNMGGLVGQAIKEGDVTKPVIHSAFAVNTMTGSANTVVGGLVGINGADLYNSYANVTMAENNQATQLGGLVGINQTGCTVENCYVINPIGPAFAYDNKGYVNYCYAANGIVNYVGEGSTGSLTGKGNYGAVNADIKHLDYLYRDNLIAPTTNTYVSATGEPGIVGYINNHIPVWNGLLSALNQWVREKNTTTTDPLYGKNFTSWFRPIRGYVNGDLPVLGFPKDNSMGTLDSDGKFLRYGSCVDFNGIDALLTYYNDNGEDEAEPNASIFHYGVATDVVNVPQENVAVTINEDAVLLQKQNTTSGGKEDANPANFKATVGVTFDNSERGGADYWGEEFTYDWHMLSSSLSDAKIGAKYKDYDTHYFGSPVDIKSLEDSYFPNGLPMNINGVVKWDFYNYYEPEYHWINLKRNKNDHWHTDDENEVHKKIDYDQPDQGMSDEESAACVFTPGKGYMMAIENDTYMNSTGTLNNGSVSIDLTAEAPSSTVYNKGWNLIGNPYQAYLDLDELPSYTFYTFDADQRLFVPYTKTASENPEILSQYIHPHQGFFVKTETNTTMTFDYDMATGNSVAGSYYREAKVNYPLVNLIVENELHNRDIAVIEFHRPELGGAYKLVDLNNTKFRLAARFDNAEYGILFTPEGTERVPVWFTTKEDGVFTLTWNTHNGIFSSLHLIDNLTGVDYDMLANDSYTFEASTGDYASRFYITYSCTDVEEYNESNDSFAFFDGSEWIINGKGYLEVVDVMGRVLFTERLTNDQNRVSLNGYAKGVYLMRVSDNKNVKVQKIVVR